MEELDEVARLLPRQRQLIDDDDAVQEGFLKMAKRGTRDLENPGGYWYTAARRAQIERRRKTEAEQRTVASWLEIQQAPPPMAYLDDSVVRHLAELVEGLKGKRRALAELELSGTTRVSDLAEHLGISAGAVKVLRHRTYRQLRQALTAELGMKPVPPGDREHRVSRLDYYSWRTHGGVTVA
jgi:RNA polymerase sigma factor (sigma-70 family)